MGISLLMNRIWYEDYTSESVAKDLGLTVDEFFRKITGEDAFTFSDISTLKALLGLSNEEVDRIFFTESGPKVI